MNKVISTALFGDLPKTHYGSTWYGEYVPSFVLAALNLFPQDDGWSIRVHVDETVANNKYGHLLARMAEDKLVELVRMPGPTIHTYSMLWRLSPVFDPDVDYVFCRDLDALPMPRDRACCESFIRSKCVVHALHDNKEHSGIPGGLCGFYSPAFRSWLKSAENINTLEDLYRYANKTDREWAVHGTDQLVLSNLIVRPGGPKLLEHRYSGWANGKSGQNPPRAAGQYACGGLSARIPNVGVQCFSLEEMTAEADRLAPFMGAAGYDYKASRGFYEAYGSRELAQRVAACEQVH